MHVKTIITLYSIFLAKIISVSTQNENPVVKTKLGFIKGKHVIFDETNSVDVFLGIPYAQPPINSLRFALPKPIHSWNETVLNATEPRNACMQVPKDYFNLTVPVSEDCLYLNVWRPTVPINCSNNASNCLRTTMIWIHGGGFTARYSSQDLFDGREFVTIGNVILVTINYRLDAFSFITDNSAESPGNLALYDQLCAIQWVSDNIISFGGNSSSITIFGQSAGSYSISSLIVSPVVISLNKKLFNRAILQSGSSFIYTEMEWYMKTTNYKEKSKTLAKSVGCEGNNWFNCMRGIDAFKLLNYTYMNKISFSLPLQGSGDKFNPIKTVNALKSRKFLKNIDLMFGTTRDEGSSFVPQYSPNGFAQMFSSNFNKWMAEKVIGELIIYPELNRTEIIEYYMSLIKENSTTDEIRKVVYDVIGDFLITCPTYLFGKTFAKYSPFRRVYGYVLTHQLKESVLPICNLAKWMGVCHSDDIALVFGLPLRYPQLYSAEDVAVSKMMIKSWTAFAKYGNPNINEMQKSWPEFRPNLNILSINEQINEPIENLNANIYEINEYMNNTFKRPYKNNCDNIWAKYMNSTNSGLNNYLNVFYVKIENFILFITFFSFLLYIY